MYWGLRIRSIITGRGFLTDWAWSWRSIDSKPNALLTGTFGLLAGMLRWYSNVSKVRYSIGIVIAADTNALKASHDVLNWIATGPFLSGSCFTVLVLPLSLTRKSSLSRWITSSNPVLDGSGTGLADLGADWRGLPGGRLIGAAGMASLSMWCVNGSATRIVSVMGINAGVIGWPKVSKKRPNEGIQCFYTKNSNFCLAQAGRRQPVDSTINFRINDLVINRYSLCIFRWIFICWRRMALRNGRKHVFQVVEEVV